MAEIYSTQVHKLQHRPDVLRPAIGKPKIKIFLPLVIWLLSVGIGLFFLVNYSYTSTADPLTRLSWPTESNLEDASSKQHLLIFLHPKCTCSTASVNELHRVLAQLTENELEVTAVVYCPENEPEEWAHTELWRRAAEIDGASMRIDSGGKEASQFGVTTSGHVFLFDADNQLRFSGGVTNARSHEGPSLGSSKLIAALHGKSTVIAGIPVFGCKLFSGAN